MAYKTTLRRNEVLLIGDVAIRLVRMHACDAYELAVEAPGVGIRKTMESERLEDLPAHEERTPRVATLPRDERRAMRAKHLKILGTKTDAERKV